MDQLSIKPDTVRESMKRAFRRVGIGHMTCHGLRHWYATHLLDSGVPITIVARQMRHSSVDLLMSTYANHDVGRSIHDALG